MRVPLVLAALVAAVSANPMPQGVTATLSPSAPAPPGCSPSYPGSFQIQPLNLSTSAGPSKVKRQGALTLTLSNGILLDSQQRTGYIAANRQFQFDNPPQTGAKFTAGWSVCANQSLALGGSTVFYSCLSGSFSNLYDQSQGKQCGQVALVVSPAAGASSSAAPASSAPASSAAPASSVRASSSAAPATSARASSAGVSQITDGQPQASSAVSKVSQISDGQPQASSAATRVSQISDGQIQASTAAPRVSQISDGQIQATSARVSQISDGQIQASSAAPRPSSTSSAARVSQISDGQIQATSAASSARVSQISDGQIQASSAASSARVSQISDGQIQATTAVSSARVSQISDGQVQASTSVVRFTGAAAQPTAIGNHAFALAAGVAAVAFL